MSPYYILYVMSIKMLIDDYKVPDMPHLKFMIHTTNIKEEPKPTISRP